MAFLFSNNVSPKKDEIEIQDKTILQDIKLTYDTENIREFDLNIESILENWTVSDALREIISNAIDEQILSQTQEIQIFESKSNIWHIKDYGRGLKYQHLTQNENEEKLTNNRVIGKFGVGLKDSLATLYRHNVIVTIKSKFGTITIGTTNKNGFEDIITLHAYINNSDYIEVGTEFILENCNREQIDLAKSMFVKFNDVNVLETTEYGDIIESKEMPCIYINGVKVAEESNFLFSYNITSINKSIKMALNRERTNVGRTAYSSRIKAILLKAISKPVLEKLIYDIQQYSDGNCHDEMQWTDVCLYVTKELAKQKTNFVFVSPDNAVEAPDVLQDAVFEGHKPIILPQKLIDKIDEINYEENEPIINTITQYTIDKANNQEFEFVDYNNLNKIEKSVFNKKFEIFNLIGGKPDIINDILISEKLVNFEVFTETKGLWSSVQSAIIIKRSILQSLEEYAGVLLHETAHAISGAKDYSREFENELTRFIGLIIKEYVKKSSS